MSSFSYRHVRYDKSYEKNQLYAHFYDVPMCQYGGLVRGSNERVNIDCSVQHLNYVK